MERETTTMQATIHFQGVSEYLDIRESLIAHGYGKAIDGKIVIDFRQAIIDFSVYLDMGSYATY